MKNLVTHILLSASIILEDGVAVLALCWQLEQVLRVKSNHRRCLVDRPLLDVHVLLDHFVVDEDL